MIIIQLPVSNVNVKNIETLRNDYSDAGIDSSTLKDNPFDFFSDWFEQALSAGIAEANGMVIATVDKQQQVSQRTVLMKSFDTSGFYFYTNYASRKALALVDNPSISCLFPWLALHRQVAFQGTVSVATRQQSDQYFATRPRGSQIGAWASRQSAEMSSRELFENQIAEIEEKFRGQDVPRPEFWGGYHVKPSKVEFWQGRTSRLHDRIIYTLTESDSPAWKISQLYP